MHSLRQGSPSNSAQEERGGRGQCDADCVGGVSRPRRKPMLWAVLHGLGQSALVCIDLDTMQVVRRFKRVRQRKEL